VTVSLCSLRLGGRGLDDEAALAVAFVDRLGPEDDRRALDAAQVDIAASPFADVHADQGAATAVFRIGNASEVAAAAKLAVTELVAFAAELPQG
jgi:hypothetical protein